MALELRYFWPGLPDKEPPEEKKERRMIHKRKILKDKPVRYNKIERKHGHL